MHHVTAMRTIRADIVQSARAACTANKEAVPGPATSRKHALGTVGVRATPPASASMDG